MTLKQLKTLCKILEEYESENGDSEIEFLIDGQIYVPESFDYCTNSNDDIWKLNLNLIPEN